jgi:hypothetical protein
MVAGARFWRRQDLDDGVLSIRVRTYKATKLYQGNLSGILLAASLH